MTLILSLMNVNYAIQLSEAEILDGWVEAGLAGYTESSGLGRTNSPNSDGG